LPSIDSLAMLATTDRRHDVVTLAGLARNLGDFKSAPSPPGEMRVEQVLVGGSV
jgi:hypothetical protein